MSLCHIHSARSLSARPSCFGSDRLLRSLHSYRFAQPMVHLRLSALLATALFLSAADPHASGRSASRVRSARTATLPAITTAAIAVCASFSPSITDPHTSGRIIACALYTYTASLCQRSFRKSGERLTHTSFQQSPGLLHSLPDLFLCSFSLAQSLCSLMLRSSTPSFTSFTQPSYFMANASLCSSGFCRQ